MGCSSCETLISPGADAVLELVGTHDYFLFKEREASPNSRRPTSPYCSNAAQSNGLFIGVKVPEVACSLAEILRH